MTERDPFSVAAGAAAAAIADNFEAGMARFDDRPRAEASDVSPAFERAAMMMTQLHPVRLALTRAQRAGRNAYVTCLNGVPIAFTKHGWMLQEDVDRQLARQKRR